MLFIHNWCRACLYNRRRSCVVEGSLSVDRRLQLYPLRSFYLSGLFFFFFLQGMAHTHWSQDIVETAWVYRVWIRQTFPDVPPMSPSFCGLRTTFPEPHPYGGLWQSQSKRGPSWSRFHASHAGLGLISAGETCVYGGGCLSLCMFSDSWGGGRGHLVLLMVWKMG